MTNTQTTKQQQIDIYQYIQLVLRRKWIIIFSAIPVLILGFLYCLFAPLVYKSSSLIVVVPQKVPESYIRTTVTGRNDERIRGILQEITSRTTLEKLIKKFDLYPGMRQKLPMETVVERMKKEIAIENPPGARQNAFLLSYEGRDPKLVTKVVNALANMFVEQNLQLRTSQSANTAKFLSSELNKVYVKLKKREETLKKYKMAHMGELPEQRESNLSTLTALQQQLQNIQESIRRAQDRRLLLRQQISDQRTSLNMAAASGRGSESGTDSPNSSGASLPELKQRLKLLRSRYTDEHPDVIALERVIREQENALSARQKDAGVRSKNVPTISLTGNPALDALNLQLRSTGLEIKQLNREMKDVQQKIQVYQQRIENTPKREQELIDLTRDYDNLKQSYDTLLQKKLEAGQAAALERRQEGEQFRIIDPARVPEKPIKPDLKKLIPMIILFGLGSGLGLAFVLDFLSPKFFDPDDVKKAFGLPILACIPVLLTDEEMRKRRLKEIRYGAFAVSCYLIVGILLFILIKKGPGAFSGLI